MNECEPIFYSKQERERNKDLNWAVTCASYVIAKDGRQLKKATKYAPPPFSCADDYHNRMGGEKTIENDSCDIHRRSTEKNSFILSMYIGFGFGAPISQAHLDTAFSSISSFCKALSAIIH